MAIDTDATATGETVAPPAGPGSQPAGPAGSVVWRTPGRRDLDPVRHRRRQRALELSLATALPVALFALWELAAQQGWIDVKFFPAPSRIWSTGVELLEDGKLQHATWVSSRRLLYGFTIGSLAGILAAIPVSMSRLARTTIEPTLYALYTVPKLALLPLLLLIFGLGETPIIALVVINCFFLVFIPTLQAFISVPVGYYEVSRSFQATRLQELWHVTLPGAVPQIVVALRIAAGAAILTVIAVEFVNSREGLGFLIWNSWTLFFAAQMYVGILVVAILGAAFTLVVGRVGRALSPWHHER